MTWFREARGGIAGSLFLGMAGAGGLLLATAVFHFWLFLMLPGNVGGKSRLMRIEPGMNAYAIAQALEREGVTTDARRFYLLCWVRGGAHRLQAGEYLFPPFAVPDAILRQIMAGRVVTGRVTIPEGSTIRDVAHILEEKGLAVEGDILRLASDRDFAGRLGLDVFSLEGYLFPETYVFKTRQEPGSLLSAMVHQFQRRLPQGWEGCLSELRLTLHEVVILASLVEKEAAVEGERPRIAAVFLNRLRKNMPLQSDPTAVYDLPGFTGPVRSEHLRRISPYNTYLNRGLPVGPICSPGAASVQAALHPEKVDFLYFVSNHDGTHHFSESLAEHNRVVARNRRRQAPAFERRNASPAPLCDPFLQSPALVERICVDPS